MSADGDEPPGKGGGRPPPSTLAGVPMNRAGLPPPQRQPGAPAPPPPQRRPGGPTSPPPRPATPSYVPPPATPAAPAHPSAPPASTPYPSEAPTQQFAHPDTQPFAQPNTQPFAQPSTQPFAQPSTQPFAQPNTQPFAQPNTQPFAQPDTQPHPLSQPYAQPAAQQASQPYVQPAYGKLPGEPDPAWTAVAPPGVPQATVHKGGEDKSSPIQQIADVIEDVPGRFVGFLKISAKRAFRLRIEPTEVLPDERQMLASASPPIVEPNLQAFLAWRRSVLFLVATILVPLSIMGLIDSLSGKNIATPVRFVKLLPTLAETAFCLICWWQLKHWHHWRSQRKWLLVGWLLFMLSPFVVFIYPLRSAFVDMGRAMSLAQLQELGWNGVYNKAVAPFAFAMIAMLQLAPKVISLMPGLIRSSMVIKLLFPGSAAPGWLIVMAAPLYALIAYALLIIPYQFTGEPWFIFGILLIVFGQALVARSGFRLARPLSQDEALKHIKRIRRFYLIIMLLALGSIVGGLGLMVKLLDMKWTSVITTVLKFESNVLILTTIGADAVVTNLDRARHYTEGQEHIEEETEDKIGAFVGLNAPPPGSTR